MRPDGGGSGAGFSDGFAGGGAEAGGEVFLVLGHGGGGDGLWHCCCLLVAVSGTAWAERWASGFWDGLGCCCCFCGKRSVVLSGVIVVREGCGGGSSEREMVDGAGLGVKKGCVWRRKQQDFVLTARKY